MQKQIFTIASLLAALVILINPLASVAAQGLTSDETVFDFVASAPLAQWKSGAGALPFPGTSGDARGYAQKLEAPVQEDGVPGAPGLLTVPHNKYDGYIQGIYPEFVVQKGDRFKVTVGCEYGAKNCYVTYRLDYLNAGGATKILWSWKEKYEGRTYSADVDLSSLAGQKVRFVLTMLATGYASEDRPLWVAPRLTRPGNGLTPPPTLTPTATPFVTPPPVTPAACDRAAFVADVTVRDGTSFAPGEAFTKTWRLKNAGSCAWTKDYRLVFYGGEPMNAPTVASLPWTVYPGQMVDVSVNAVAPTEPGLHRSDWILRNAAGQLFGLGVGGDKPFWMLLNVTGAPPVAESGYDFAANLCAAEWRSGAGGLPCPLGEGDSRGFALSQSTRLEDGNTAASAILTQPQNKYDGYIQGTFPTFTVQPGDRFQATVGCQYNVSCYVTLRLEYLTAGGAPRIFWKWAEKNEGKTYHVDLDLSPLAGQSLRFVLTTLATGSPLNDRAVWAEPRIVRPGLQAPTLPPPTAIPGELVPTPYLSALFMLDASNGWATGENETLRTSDGGATWRNVLPGVAPGGAYFLNASTGWVLGNTGQLYRTSDGGSHWNSSPVPFTSGQLHFPDSLNGFIMTGAPIGMHKQPIALYQTRDGGLTWTLNYENTPEDVNPSLPVGGHKSGMAFRDASNGWIGGDIPMNGYFYLYQTSNSGQTWTRRQLSLPAGYETAYVTTSAPTFFGTQQALLPVWLTPETGGRALFLYASADGGNTWSFSPSATQAREFISLGSTQAAFAFVGDNNLLASTHNAGQTWEVVTPNVNFGDFYRKLDFVSGSTGWLLLFPGNGSTPLYRTSDGGATWSLLFGLPPALNETPTPIPSPTPSPTPETVFSSPYAVMEIAAEAGLNVYAAADTTSALLGAFPSDARQLERGSQVVNTASGAWVEALLPGGLRGWVPDRNLTEYVAPEQFVSDTRAAQLIALLKQAVNTSDGDLLAALVSPKRGLQIMYHGSYGQSVSYTPEQVRQVFTSAEAVHWGAEGASGLEAVGTFAEMVQPKLQETLNAAYELTPNEYTYATSYYEPWPSFYQNLNYFGLLKPPSPEVYFDWRLWLVGIEYVNGQPYIFTLNHYIWEP